MKKNEVIKCPHCGAEYLPAEIFYPKYFLGSVSDVIKDGDGKIITYDGSGMDTTETYECDYCKTKFEARAKVSFDAVDVNEFEEEYSTPRYVQLSLFEEDNE